MGQETPQAASGPNGPARTGQAHAHVLAFLMTVAISTSFPLGEHITHGLDPAVLMCIRFVLAALLLAPIVAWREGLALPTPRSIVRYFALGAPLAFFFWCMFEALRDTSGLNTAAIFTIVPGLSALFGAVLVGERLGIHRIATLFLGMIGALWIIFRGDPARLLALEVNIGDGIFLAGCFGFGIYGPLIKRLHRGEPVLVQTFWTLVAAAIWLVAASNVQALAHRLVGGRGGGAGRHRLSRDPADHRHPLPRPVHDAPHRRDAGAGLTSTRCRRSCFSSTSALGKPAPPLMTIPGLAIVLVASLVVQRGAIREFRP